MPKSYCRPTISSICRTILNKVGAGWVSPAHENSHGNNSFKISMVDELFKNLSKSDLQKIIEKFRIDLEMCGYDRTLKALEALVNKK